MNRRNLATAAIALPVCVILTACFAHPLRAQHADDYAVWSAAIDAELGKDSVPAFWEPERTKRLENQGIIRQSLLSVVSDTALVDQYLRRNRLGARIDARRLAPSRVRIVTRGSQERGFMRIDLSRPGYDAARTHALVRVGEWCGEGILCGHGVVLLMERGGDGQWRKVRIVSSYMS